MDMEILGMLFGGAAVSVLPNTVVAVWEALRRARWAKAGR